MSIWGSRRWLKKPSGGSGLHQTSLTLYIVITIYTVIKISVFDQWGALNSPPIWQAFRAGATRLGHAVVSHDMTADVAVIWSMVWQGRMKRNRAVWQHFRQTNRPVIVLEVGTLRRGITWKMGLNGLGSIGQCATLDQHRAAKLGISLKPWQQPGSDIVILLQRSDSEQWQNMPSAEIWLANLVVQLRKATDRIIRVRQHPRRHVIIPQHCELDPVARINGSYDDFDIDRSLSKAWAVINHNSGVGVRCVLDGIPLFCDQSSLAAPVGNLDWSLIERPAMPPREPWFEQLCHTEYTPAEIRQGWPIDNLLKNLSPQTI